MESKKKIAILGAGISGLSVAYYLKQKFDNHVDIHIFEKSERCGGIIQSLQQENFILEQGPDCFLAKDKQILSLIEELGLQEALIKTNEAFRRSYIFKNGKLISTPKGFYLIAPKKLTPFLFSKLLSLKGKLRALGDLFIPRKKSPEDESLANFVRRRFGTELLENMAQPMAAGIYTADPEQLSMQSCFPKFVEIEKKHRSIIRGIKKNTSLNIEKDTRGPRYNQFLSLKNGMESLILSLKNKVQEHLHYKTDIIDLKSFGSRWTLLTKDKKYLEFDHVIFALPSHQTQKLLANSLPKLSTCMGKALYGSSAIVNLAYNKTENMTIVPGMGYVVPHKENRPIIACSIISQKFKYRSPSESKILFRVFMGGGLNPDILNKSDEELKSIAHQELAEQFNISEPPIVFTLKRWNQCMPQYTLEHLSQMEAFKQESEKYPTLHFLGNGYTGLGLPDMVKQSFECVETFKI